MMLKEDKEKLKELVMNYPPDMLLKELASAVSEVADEMADGHEGAPPPIVKRYTVMASSLEDLMSGRPFLV